MFMCAEKNYVSMGMCTKVGVCAYVCASENTLLFTKAHTYTRTLTLAHNTYSYMYMCILRYNTILYYKHNTQMYQLDTLHKNKSAMFCPGLVFRAKRCSCIVILSYFNFEVTHCLINNVVLISLNSMAIIEYFHQKYYLLVCYPKMKKNYNCIDIIRILYIFFIG